MKQTPELDRVQEKMQPGEITLDGFLGDDDRKLVDILIDDAETVQARGILHKQIADRLDELAEEGRDIAERELEVEDRYKVRVRDDRGVLPSPWGDGRFSKADVHMDDPVTGLSFRWNRLTTHMIREYGFYGGHGSPYRINPADIIRALELSPMEETESPDPPMPSERE
jgi:hypothetical protein